MLVLFLDEIESRKISLKLLRYAPILCGVGNQLYSWVERGNSKVNYLVQELNMMTSREVFPTVLLQGHLHLICPHNIIPESSIDVTRTKEIITNC